MRDLARTQKFYERLGGKVTSLPSDRFLEIDLGAQKLHILLGADDDTKPGPIHHFALRMESLSALEKLCAILNQCPELQEWVPFSIQESPPMGAHGQVERTPPHRTLYFRDPDGILLEARCYF